MLVYGSVCSGIEAATVAWHPLGWRPSFFSEIDAFPRAVLAHHYPGVSLHGDFTTIQAGDYEPIDLLVGGTPCQSFSVAGLRRGLADDRGNLALEYLRLADRLRPDWLVWENVPGVLSSNGGRDFGAILGGMVKLGYGFSYRVLDAQYFGVPQRRRRVFVVGYFGDWRPAAAVLFERHSLQGHPAPRREAGERVAGTFSAGSHPGGCNGQDAYNGLLVTHALRGKGFDASEEGTGRGTPLVPVAFGWQNSASQGISVSEHVTPSLDKSKTRAIAFDTTQITSKENGSNPQPGDPCHPRAAGAHAPAIIGAGVRRLMPVECERLQGFPDGYTAVSYRGKPAADGPRYKALGNSMAVPVMRWIGERIEAVRTLMRKGVAA